MREQTQRVNRPHTVGWLVTLAVIGSVALHAHSWSAAPGTPLALASVGPALVTGSCLAALLLGGFTMFEHLRGRLALLPGTRATAWLVGALGSGLLVFALSRTTEESLGSFPSVLIAAALLGLSWGLHRRPTRTVTGTILVMFSCALAGLVSIPYVGGPSIQTFQRSVQASGWVDRCGDVSEMEVVYSSPPIIESHLEGNFGEFVNAELDRTRPAHVQGAARVHVTIEGSLEYGGLTCHLPLHKWDHIEGELRASYDCPSRYETQDDAPCTSSLQIAIDVEATGLVTCRALVDATVRSIVTKIHEQAKTACGPR